MSLLDTYRGQLSRAKSTLADLQKKKSAQAAKSADFFKRKNASEAAANKSKSDSTIKSKLREAEKYSDQYAASEKAVAVLENKISSKQKEINDLENKVRREEEKENIKKEKIEKKKDEDAKKRLNKITSQIDTQERRQSVMEADIDRLKNVPEKISVLFLATNPKDTDKLRLDEEARSIREMITKAKHRDSMDFETRWAVRTIDFLQSINEVSPAIIHFSGHGAENGDLAFEDPNGFVKLVTPEAISQVISTVSDSVKLAFFDACDSEIQAEQVVDVIYAAIGMKAEISDSAATAFASQFYSAIGFGLSVGKAFDQARAYLMMEFPDEADTPVLHTRANIDPYDLVIVKPA